MRQRVQQWQRWALENATKSTGEIDRLRRDTLAAERELARIARRRRKLTTSPTSSRLKTGTELGTPAPNGLELSENKQVVDGEGGIRTHGGVTPTPVFETGLNAGKIRGMGKERAGRDRAVDGVFFRRDHPVAGLAG